MIQLNNMMKSENINRTRWWLHNWLDFAYFEKYYRLIAADLSKQTALDADSRAVQQIILTGKIKATLANTRVVIFYILEKSKKAILEFSKETTKVL